MGIKKTNYREDNYRCTFYSKRTEKEFEDSLIIRRDPLRKDPPEKALERDRACWARIKYEGYICDENEIIFISNFKAGIRSKYIEEVVELINYVTDCSIIEEDLISYKLLKYYGQNLLLLNLIRSTWFTDRYSIGDNFIALDKFYNHLTSRFREEKNNKDFDPILLITQVLAKLMPRNNRLFLGRGHYYEGDHSSSYCGIIPKSMKKWKQLYSSEKIFTLQSFLKDPL